MIASFILLLMSLTGVLVAVFLSGWSDLILLAGPATVASLYLFLRAWLGGRGTRRWAVVDGSNVMYWATGAPEAASLRGIVAQLRARGLTPYVVFDANAGYLLRGRYLDHARLAELIDLPARQVTVVGKGMPADPLILKAARSKGACVITNDRYRDWSEHFPEVTRPGVLVRGGYREGQPWLALPKA